MSPKGSLLPDPPADGVSSLGFFPGSDLLLATSWDCTARLYSASISTHRTTVNVGEVPLLSSAASATEGRAWCGSLDGVVRLVDLETGVTAPIGMHSSGASCLSRIDLGGDAGRSLAASASWDRTVRLWDSRAPPGANMAAEAPLPGKAVSSDSDGCLVVVATVAGGLAFWDLRGGGVVAPADPRGGLRGERGDKENGGRVDALRPTAGGFKATLSESASRPAPDATAAPRVVPCPLRHQPRCVRLAAGGSTLALGSADGRVALAPVPGSVGGGPDYTFKCHRAASSGGGGGTAADAAPGEARAAPAVAHAVNALAFNPKLPATFATGGSDGSLCIWDGGRRRRLAHVPGYKAGVSHLSFDYSGSLLAVAESYGWERGEEGAGRHPERIWIRRVDEAEAHLPEKSRDRASR